MKKLLDLKGSVALAAQALEARSSIHEANHQSAPELPTTWLTSTITMDMSCIQPRSSECSPT